MDDGCDRGRTVDGLRQADGNISRGSGPVAYSHVYTIDQHMIYGLWQRILDMLVYTPQVESHRDLPWCSCQFYFHSDYHAFANLCDRLLPVVSAPTTSSSFLFLLGVPLIWLCCMLVVSSIVAAESVLFR